MTSRTWLYNAFIKCIEKGCLSPTMKTGLITLLSISNKDLLKCDNWRPITLFCDDYKILALLYAYWLKHVLAELVDIYQSALIKVRNIQQFKSNISDARLSISPWNRRLYFVHWFFQSIWLHRTYISDQHLKNWGLGFNSMRSLKCSIMT